MLGDTEIVELIARVRRGDGDAFAVLATEYEPLISSLSYTFCSQKDSFELDNCLQEGRVALLRAARTYNTEQSAVTFGLYAKICVRHALISLARKNKDKIELYSLDAISDTDDTYGALAARADVADILIENERAENIYHIIKELLSDYELSVFNLFIEGNTVAQIAKALNKSEKSVANTVNRFKVKLREFLK